jgi:class 3 adenylate cyclase
VPEIVGRLLVVDDNKVNRLLLERTLTLLGHSVMLAENGREGLERLRSEQFDLLLLDIEMPEMDGFEVLNHLKGDPTLRDLPVIVASSLEGLDNVVRCIELGADDYLSKPVNHVLLKARVGAMLEKKALRDQQAELVRRFATPEVADDLQRSGFSIGGRRMVVSVLFVDIRGFTSIVEQLEPEATIDLLNEYYTLTFDAITSNGGVVNQFIGDGLMAIFGAPKELDDTATSALRAAIEMTEVIAMYSEGRVAAGELAVAIGVGIATGEVVAGYTGTDRRATYTCVGDTVNRAARLESLTKEIGHPIAIDGATRSALTAEFDLVPLGEIPIRGKSRPVEAYAVRTIVV